MCRAALGLWVPIENAAHVSPCPGARGCLGGREVGLGSAREAEAGQENGEENGSGTDTFI